MTYLEFKQKWTNKTDLEIALMSNQITSEEGHFKKLEEKLSNGFYWRNLEEIEFTLKELKYWGVLTEEEAKSKKISALKNLIETLNNKKEIAISKNKNISFFESKIKEILDLLEEIKEEKKETKFEIDEEIVAYGDAEPFKTKEEAIDYINEWIEYNKIPSNSGFWRWAEYDVENLPRDDSYISKKDAEYFVYEIEIEDEN